MAILTNPRHEKFVLALSKGTSATQAYIEAGYKPCRQNAARLMSNDDIQARLREIQSQAAKAAEVTVESLLAELEEARQKATNLDQLSAAVRAIEAKAKVSGLLLKKVEVGRPGEFNSCQTFEDIVDEFIRETYADNPHAHFTPSDRAKIITMLQEITVFMDSCAARPVNGAMVDDNTRRPRQIELRRRHRRSPVR